MVKFQHKEQGNQTCFVKKNLKHIILFDLCYRGVHNDGCCGRIKGISEDQSERWNLSTTYKTMDGEEKTRNWLQVVCSTATPTDKSGGLSSTAIRTIENF